MKTCMKLLEAALGYARRTSGMYPNHIRTTEMIGATKKVKAVSRDLVVSNGRATGSMRLGDVRLNKGDSLSPKPNWPALKHSML